MRTVILAISLFAAVSCDGSSLSITAPPVPVPALAAAPAPTPASTGDTGTAGVTPTATAGSDAQLTGTPNLSAWKPCIVVQSPGGIAQDIQFQAIEKLQRNGTMTWIRLNAYADGSAQPYHRIAASMGLRIFSIIHLRDLDRLGWTQAFETVYQLYPETEIFEIAGEVSNPDPFVNEKTTTAASYMERFKELYAYVKLHYPHVRLTSAPPMGSANGPEELEEFINLGLLDMDVIVALNVYTEFALSQYAAVFTRHSKKMAQRKIWVTETGSRDPSQHVAWVNDMYPKIQNSLRPEMTCWYVLWGGDEGESSKDNGFGLISGVEHGEYVERQLFQELTRTTGGK